VNHRRALRLLFLLRHLAGEAGEVSRLDVVIATSATSTAAARVAIAVAAAAASPPTAAARLARFPRAWFSRRSGNGSGCRGFGCWNNSLRGRRRVLVHFGVDHDMLDPAEEAALLDEYTMRNLIWLDAERLGGGGECFFETMSFEPLGRGHGKGTPVRPS
jgi:hypothetical protein